jgi:hypothetical protein
MAVFARNKALHKNLSAFIILLVHNVAQNKMTSDKNIISVLNENLSEVEFICIVNEIGNNLSQKWHIRQ